MRFIVFIITLMLLNPCFATISNQKLIGSHLIIGINHYPVHPTWLKFIKENNISGVIFLSDAYKNAKNVKEAIDTIKKNTNHPMYFCIDQEGGRVSRIKENMIEVPPASHVATTLTPSEAFDLYQKQANNLVNIGINVNFSPVLDILNHEDNNVIGSRSFGVSADTVFEYAKQVINASLMNGVLPVAKHFPGHGYTYLDSHFEMPVHNNLSQLLNNDLIPFKKSIAIGVPAIMVAHILYPDLDNTHPASLSKTIVTDLLKKKLRFKGLVFSDDLAMGAIKKKYRIDNALRQTLKAGVHQAIIIETLPVLKHIIQSISKTLDSNISFKDSLKENIITIQAYK